MKTVQTIFVLLNIFLPLSSPDTHKLKLIGIYSICGNGFAENFQIDAHAVDLAMRYIFHHYKWYEEFDYVSYDVCFDQSNLTSVITELALDTEFYAVNGNISFGNNSYKVTSKATKILGIITHLPDEMLKIVLSLFLLDNAIVSRHSNLIEEHSTLEENFKNFINLQFDLKDIENLFTAHTEWKEIVMLNISRAKTKSLVENVLYRKKICYKTLKILTQKDIANLFSILKLMNKEEIEDYTILFTIGALANVTRKIVKFLQQENLRKKHKMILVKREFGKIYSMDYLRLVGVAPSILETYGKDRLQFLLNFTETSSSRYGRMLGPLFSYIHVLKAMTEKNLKKNEVYNDLHHLKLLQTFKKPSDTLHECGVPVYHYPNTFSKCFHPNCSPGYEKAFGIINDSSIVWKEVFGYYCKPCQNSLYKSTHGDAECQKCEGHFIPNQLRTKCIDPLTPTIHELTDVTVVIMITLSSIGFCLALAFMVIFIRYRETPVVKSADFLMSLSHLGALKLNFLLLPAVYSIEPSPTVCALKILPIAFFFNVNTSISYIKSLKLLKAYLAKGKLRKSEIMRTTLTQLFLIALNVVIASLITVVLWNIEFPGVSIRLDMPNSRKILFCNNGFQIQILAIFMMSLLVICFCQAFRCRKLPNHVTEAMNIVYGSFAEIIAFGVTFPIYHFQKQPEDGELVYALVLTINNLISLLFMYGEKIFIINFQPYKNTKLYFRAKQFEEIQLKSKRQLILTKSISQSSNHVRTVHFANFTSSI